MKKLFHQVNLTWKKLIISSILIGLYVGIVNSIPILKSTSFTDIAVTFEWWVLFGIIIITNSKSNKDSALKCFVFFLISQPVIYLIEGFSSGWIVLYYYKYWFFWTLLCLPMGYIGYYLKKDKLWTLIILFPMLILLASEAYDYASVLYSYKFPHHLLTSIYCFVVPYVLVSGIYNNKKVKKVGYGLCILITIVLFTMLTLKYQNGFQTYNAEIMSNSEEQLLNENTIIKVDNKSLGDFEINLVEEQTFRDYILSAKFKKMGSTNITLINGDVKTTYKVTVKEEFWSIDKVD